MAADYRPSDKETTQFFRVIQNKLHYASTGMTAAELIAKRIDAGQPNMGLTSFKYEEVRRTDDTIAKNYLNADEYRSLARHCQQREKGQIAGLKFLSSPIVGEDR